MRKLLLVSLMTAFCLTALSPEIYAQSNSEEITQLMKVVNDTPRSKFVNKHDFAPEEEEIDIIAIFYYDGRRYSVWYDSEFKDLKFYFVPKGKMDYPIQMLGDANADGQVDYISHEPIMEVSILPGTMLYNIKTLSDEHQRYWQKEYNKAMEGLKATIK